MEDKKEEISEEKQEDSEGSKEESELEENLKEKPKINEDKFKDIFININKNSPSLEQVAVAPKTQVTLETNLANVSPEKSKEDEIKYNAINYASEDKKTYEENVRQQDENLTMKTDLLKARDNPWDMPQQRNEMKFTTNPELEGAKKTYEENMAVKNPSMHFEETKTHDPFQRETKKDKFYEFR